MREEGERGAGDRKTDGTLKDGAEETNACTNERSKRDEVGLGSNLVSPSPSADITEAATCPYFTATCCGACEDSKSDYLGSQGDFSVSPAYVGVS